MARATITWNVYTFPGDNGGVHYAVQQYLRDEKTNNNERAFGEIVDGPWRHEKSGYPGRCFRINKKIKRLAIF